MFEVLIALWAGALLWAAALAALLDPEWLLFGGLWTTAIGFAVGLPTGAVYHVALYRSLTRIDALPAGWWWRPLHHHGLLPAEDRPRVLAWCFAGAAGFVVILIGLAITTIGALRLI